MSAMLDVQNLSKCYRRPRADGGGMEDFWALRDISFSVNEGEVVGFIGKNGAGKSTLLKILSRITAPTSGQARLRGRVGSLLEVGTGFHPEMTGRENVFMNGIMLGMRREEIRRNYDAIVEFSGVGDFIETPVKRYSSGMYTRLAFAVAAHLEPEVLIVDEVLAVGDMRFQQKCLDKMREVSSQGRTVLFVSHSMDAVQSLCSRVMVLDNGVTAGLKPMAEAIHGYISMQQSEQVTSHWESEQGIGDENLRLRRATITGVNDVPLNGFVEYGDNVLLVLKLDANGVTSDHTVGFALYDERQRLLFWSFQVDSQPDSLPRVGNGVITLSAPLPLSILQPGQYRIKPLMGLYNMEWLLGPDDAGPELTLDVQGKISDSPYWLQRRPGILAPRLDWKARRG